jgi:hypothetical protein
MRVGHLEMEKTIRNQTPFHSHDCPVSQRRLGCSARPSMLVSKKPGRMTRQIVSSPEL